MSVSVLDPLQQQLNKWVMSAYLHEFAEEHNKFNLSVRLADGKELLEASRSQSTLVIRDCGVLLRAFSFPDELMLGELFIHGDLDVEGDMEAALCFAESLMSHPSTAKMQSRLRKFALPLKVQNRSRHAHGANLKGQLHSRERDRIAVASHYDVSNDFYKLWLDRNMVYSEAYFDSSEEDLNAAQIHKLEYICRKLDLQHGEKLLDLGCGWGGLVVYAATHYHVDALGITISLNQAHLAAERIREAGLEDHCAVRVCDYRDVEPAESYDKIASIGMFEHVGACMLKTYFDRVFRLLRPGGIFLNSGISISSLSGERGPSFIDSYVFPDGELVPLHTAIQQAEMSGFEVRDVEDLREHYALTLDRWVQRLEHNSLEARKIIGDVLYRTWKLYMSASAHAFRLGRIRLYHLLLSKPDRNQCSVPITRKSWYALEDYKA